MGVSQWFGACNDRSGTIASFELPLTYRADGIESFSELDSGCIIPIIEGLRAVLARCYTPYETRNVNLRRVASRESLFDAPRLLKATIGLSKLRFA